MAVGETDIRCRGQGLGGGSTAGFLGQAAPGAIRKRNNSMMTTEVLLAGYHGDCFGQGASRPSSSRHCNIKICLHGGSF